MDPVAKVVRSTDFDALSCKVSAVKKQYLQDEFLPELVRELEVFLKNENKLSYKRLFNSITQSNKLPVINRGTYIRTKSIDDEVERFIEQQGGACQVVNLGAGSDSRCFNLLHRYHSLAYVEMDFAQSTKLKKSCILNNDRVTSLLGIEKMSVDEINANFASDNGELITERYKLVPCDLRKVEQFVAILSSSIAKSVPTIVISECCFCYIETDITNQIISSLKSYFDSGKIVIYDPIGGEDNFGNVMIENLKIRNISMPSLLKYNTIDKYHQRLVDLGFRPDQIKIQNMFDILNQVEPSELTRISRLEFLDEMEELKLLLQHYCLVVAVF